MANPVQSSGDETLTDERDSASAVSASDYAIAELRNWDGSGPPAGRWVPVESSAGIQAFSAPNTFMYASLLRPWYEERCACGISV